MDELKRYMETGILGENQPKNVCGRTLESGKIMPIFRDSICTAENGRLEVCRKMKVGSRTFTIRSIFNAKSEKTATDSLLRVIDEDLSK